MQFFNNGQPSNKFETKLVAVANGFVYIGHSDPDNTIVLAGGQSTGAPLDPSTLCSIAVIYNFAYIVDGTSTIVKVDLQNERVIPYTLSPGASTFPAPTNCQIAANWRGRLVLSSDSSHPQNIYMSRLGDPGDWDYTQSANGDPAGAFEADLGKAGLIGQPVTAFIPFTDDLAITGCTHSMWMFQGDPADGGAIIIASENLGIVGKDAWITDPANTLYFVGTGGLFSVRPEWDKYSPPKNMAAESYNQFFQGLNPSNSYVNMVWDAELHYMHIFVTPQDQSAGTHLLYDSRNGGLWPVQFTPDIGPVAACQWLGDFSPNARTILLGGWDGYIRAYDSGFIDDDGTAISSRLTLGPYQPAPEQLVLSATTVDFGELLPADSSSTWSVQATLKGGPTAFSVTEGSTHNLVTINCPLDQRQKTFRQRVRGGWFAVELSNSMPSTYFSFEEAALEFLTAGRNRERR